MTDENELFELYLAAYTKARCGADAASNFGTFQNRALPHAAVVAVAAHDGASGIPPRPWPEVRAAVEAVSAGAPAARPPAAG